MPNGNQHQELATVGNYRGLRLRSVISSLGKAQMKNPFRSGALYAHDFQLLEVIFATVDRKSGSYLSRECN